MGRPRQKTPARPAGTSRRDFFKRSGSAAVALAVVTPLVADAAPRQAFRHGVASGDPLADRVILWTRITPLQPLEGKVRVDYVVARDAALQDVVITGSSRTDASRDFTVKVDVTGLAPGQTYHYRFSHGNQHSPIGRTRTLPVGAVDHLRIAVVSCSNFAAGYFNAYRRIAERADVDLVLHLGDALYEYASGQYGSARPCDPPHEIVTLDDYRRRHAQYKGDLDSQEMLRQHPLVAIWDDHETANDAWKDGAENHQPDDGEGEWPARVAAALQAYYEWMPVREQRRNDPRRENRRFTLGNLIDLYMLEERLGARSKQLPATIVTDFGMGFTQTGDFLDPQRGLLGDKQERWLVKGLRDSGARWKLLGQGVMFAQLKALGLPNALGGGFFLNPDQWDGYQPARNRLYAAVKGSDGGPPIGNLVVLTGDIHSSWASDLTQDPNNPDAGAGGYDPGTGRGSLAVEFVGTSVTSPGLDDPSGEIAAYLRSQNPHFKYIDLNKRGYMLLDVTHQRVACEWWHVETVSSPDSRQTLARTFEVRDGAAHLNEVVAR
jgi:alkaline phosphatase D